jgi:hypothetical protein
VRVQVAELRQVQAEVVDREPVARIEMREKLPARHILEPQGELVRPLKGEDEADDERVLRDRPQEVSRRPDLAGF